MKLQENISGFTAVNNQYIREIDSDAWEFVHEKSGARLFFLKNKDDNKVFSISFRTTPFDDMGIPHIVEHSTLCGSRKYPLKEPFVDLVKGSLNTFLNAMTYPDKTMYPVASRNAKDFRNLMDVYLDAVFFPALYDEPNILRQEGWHYELPEKSGPLSYSGVVYNEMKGATSSPDDLLETEIFRALFPDSPYHYESGGNPDVIPQLTQEKFVEFHRKFYHPSNSYIFLYGDLDIEEQLAFLNDEYLAKFDRIAVDSEVALQPLFTEMKRVEKFYPVSATESTENKAFLSLSMIVDDGSAPDPVKSLALQVLNHALISSDASPLRQAILAADLGLEVSSSFEKALRQPCFTIVSRSASAADRDRFYQVIVDTLQDMVRQGFDRSLLEASLNYLEFKAREADFNLYPKGLIYGIAIMNDWLYGFDPVDGLRYEEYFLKLREGLDNGLFEDIVQKYIIDNPHKVLMSFAPDKDIAVKRDKAQAEQLEKIRAAMTDEELDRVQAVERELKQRQAEPDSPEAKATIPLLDIADIKKTPDKLPLEVRNDGGREVLFSDVDTSGITYLSLYFDMRSVPQADIPYAYLLTDILGLIGTARHSYSELVNLTNLNTGGIGFSLLAAAKIGQPDSFYPRLKVKAKAFNNKVSVMGDIVAEILTETDFDDPQRLRELVNEIRSKIDLEILSNPYQYMASRLHSYISSVGWYNDQAMLPYHDFIAELSDNFDRDFAAVRDKLKSLLAVIFNRNNLTVGLTVKEADYKEASKNLRPLIDALPDTVFPTADYRFAVQPLNEGLMTSSRVQYVGKAGNFLKLGKGYKYTGTLKVVETIMKYDYLWTKIRMQGGAYGAFASFGVNGLVSFASYRDPNLAESLRVFDEAADYIANYDAERREVVKSIIGTMSNVDVPLTPSLKGSVAQEHYLQGMTYEMRQATRDEILGTTIADIRNTAPLIADTMKQNILCVLGNEAKLKDNEAVFSSLNNVLK